MKKNNNHFLPQLKSVFVLFAGLCFLLLASCDFDEVSGPDPEPEPEPDPDPPADTLGAVAPDGILETVTWNIEWYGSFGNGPSNEDLQTNNALDVIDSLKADLYALQEIRDQTALDNLTSRMKGYRGFTAEEQPRSQHTAFVFNTQTIDSVSSGLITEGQDRFNWASGRYPFYFSFNYSYEDIQIPVYAVVIHAKCCPDEESYQRRKQAAESLHTYLTRNKPNANIVFLGDYNDDVDESIYEGNETPYISFVEDNDDFFISTSSLSQQGITSTVGFDDMVDHITVSNEMEMFYVPDSEERFDPRGFIDNYGTTTSDHFPVITKFDIRQ